MPSLLPFLAMLPAYNLPQKKCNFNIPIFPGASGFLTMTQGHVDFVIWPKVHRPTHFPRRHATSEKRGRVYFPVTTVEQEIFATGNFRDFRAEEICVQENFANWGLEGVFSFKISPCTIRDQEVFVNLALFAKIAKISCTRKFAVLQYIHDEKNESSIMLTSELPSS